MIAREISHMHILVDKASWVVGEARLRLFFVDLINFLSGMN